MIDELKIGGAQTHLVTMLRTLPAAERGDHRVVSLFGDGPIGDQIRDLGIGVTVLDLRPLLLRRRFATAIRRIQSSLAGQRPDIVEAHLTYSRLLGLVAAWRAKVPVRIGFEQGDIYLSSRTFRVANFAGQVFADRIVVCSQALANWNHRVNRFSRNRMSVFHNCVDVERFDPQQVDGPPPFERPPCRTLFCTIGTLGGGVNKRVDISIRAIAAARRQGANVGLVIAGDGDQRQALESLASDLGISDSVAFLGMRSDVPAILAASDAFCHAAPFEPFGIVCVEAMAMELPVIVPDAGGMQEAVRSGVTGFIYPVLDPHALADRMMWLDSDPPRGREMGRAGRLLASEQFSVTGYMARLDALYAGLLLRKRR